MVNFLIFGPPGSGKGTQSVRLAEKFNLMHLSTGDMLRAEITAGTDLGKKMSVIMSKGELVPDEVVIEMIAARIDSTKDKVRLPLRWLPENSCPDRSSREDAKCKRHEDRQHAGTRR